MGVLKAIIDLLKLIPPLLDLIKRARANNQDRKLEQQIKDIKKEKDPKKRAKIFEDMLK
jgi:hypothetical protein